MPYPNGASSDYEATKKPVSYPNGASKRRSHSRHQLVTEIVLIFHCPAASWGACYQGCTVLRTGIYSTYQIRSTRLVLDR
jgi:hypothetical protein